MVVHTKCGMAVISSTESKPTGGTITLRREAVVAQATPFHGYGIYGSSVLLARHCRNIENRCFARQVWRRGRDLNPRQGFWPCDGLANRCLRPLGHLSTAPTRGIREYGAG